MSDATERGVARYFGFELFEHYAEDGSVLLITSDASAIRLEPGDFVVRRTWSTGVVPHIHNEARSEAAKAASDGLSAAPRVLVPADVPDRRECGFLGCGDPRCEPVCAGVRDRSALSLADRLIEQYGNTALGRAELEARPEPVTVYVDGAYSAQDGVGGWAWWCTDAEGAWSDSGWDASPGCSNNRMELQACIEALAADHEHSPLTIVSDSAYVVNCFAERWYDGWRANGWRNSKKEPVANRDLWEELLAQLEAHRAPVEWVHVRGHGRGANDDPMHVLGNAEADRLAVAARIEGRGR